MYFNQHTLGFARQALLLNEALQLTKEKQIKRSFMNQQDDELDKQLRPAMLQEKQRLDKLADKRLREARTDLLSQAGAEITATVAKLNLPAEPTDVRLASKPGETPLQKQARQQVIEAAKGDSPDILPRKQARRTLKNQ